MARSSLSRPHLVLALVAVVGMGLAFAYHAHRKSEERARTSPDRFAAYASAAETRLRDRFETFFRMARVPYPPHDAVLVCFKDEARIEVWARGTQSSPYKLIRTWALDGPKSPLGPKIVIGDQRIPEGIYEIARTEFIEGRLALRLNYPNRFDMEMASKDKRYFRVSEPVYIRTGVANMCDLLITAEALDELSVLYRRLGKDAISVVIVPHDLRNPNVPVPDLEQIRWESALYQRLRERLQQIDPRNPLDYDLPPEPPKAPDKSLIFGPQPKR